MHNFSLFVLITFALSAFPPAIFASADADGDGVADEIDQCPSTRSGDLETVDFEGCSSRQRDSDNDGTSDLFDKCDNTPEGAETHPHYSGCAPSQLDTDNDGVTNDIDECSSSFTPEGELPKVNAVGCTLSQLDTDNDGTSDLHDKCADTPEGTETHPHYPGCAPFQLDTDNDGVTNDIDECSFTYTPEGKLPQVNAVGCALSQLDTDNDGTSDYFDKCDDTPEGAETHPHYPGCANFQLDTDGDGVTNDIDKCRWTRSVEHDSIDEYGCGPSQSQNDNADDDGDGVPNSSDAFPADASESSDIDLDGIGDNADTDRDGDGVLNTADAFPSNPTESADMDGDGIGDNADTDRDGDGVPNAEDAFPVDAAESVDLDLDGIGDNADPDRDGDGVANDVDACPLQVLPPEAVGIDGCEVVANADTDGDGIANADDLFPEDPNEWADLDNDGTGDNSDLDVDGDGVENRADRFPRDASESSDIDGDGVGDNSDADRDNDGVENALDLFPNDASETTDLDGDGIGDNSDPDRDGDGVLNDSDAYPNDPARSKLPIVTIDTPKTLVTVGYSPITVTGTVDDGATALTVNGVAVEQSGGAWAVDVALQEGHNTIVARMVDPSGITSTASIHVSLDLTPPYMTIESHKHEQIVYTPVIAVTGLINDIVRGTIEDEQVEVTVNDLPATIKNRSYLVNNVPLVEGENELSVVGIDQAGNAAVNTIRVTYAVPQGKALEIISGQDQVGITFDDLPEQLVVKVLDDTGEALADKNVVFRVTQGSGGVKVLLDDPVSRAVLAKTDANGLARTYFQLGQRAGIGNHKVTAKVVGYETQAVFHATAQGKVGNKLSINTGNNQRGGTFQPLPSPFVVAVTDFGTNVVSGARVKFETRRGGGLFENGEAEIIAITDSDGRASAHLTLGGLEGLDQQVVRATLLDAPPVDPANPESPVVEVTAGFTATGFTPKAPGLTTISGVVMNNQDQPLPGVTVFVDGTTRQAVADSQGQFKITEAPVGPVHLIADGSTTTLEGEYPALAYNIVTVSGVDNPLSAPIYMVKLNTENAVMAGGSEDVVLALPEVPGFKLEVPANSVTFPDGSREGLVSVTVVNSSKVPMAPPNGMQPQFIITIQPTGAMFDPPARLTLPNVDGQAPGAQVEMYSFDHDLEEFVAIGLGTVNENGTTITSNLGVGVIKAGWHCGSTPGGSGAGHDCGDCAECDGEFCKWLDQSRPEAEQSPADCKDLQCDGSSLAKDESIYIQENQDSCVKCIGKVPTFDPALRDTEGEDPYDCSQTLCDGTTKLDDEERPAPPGYGSPSDLQCLVCKDGAEASTEEHVPHLSQSDNDCYEKFCDGEHEPRFEEMLGSFQEKNDCQTLYCEGENTDIPKFDSGDHRPDEKPDDCMRYICFPDGLTGPEERKFKVDSQVPEDKVINACQKEIYQCGGSTYEPEVQVKEVYNHDGDPLEEVADVCLTCDAGALVGKDGRGEKSKQITIEAPGAVTNFLKRLAARLKVSDAEVKLKAVVGGSVVDCCSEQLPSGGVKYSAFFTPSGSIGGNGIPVYPLAGKRIPNIELGTVLMPGGSVRKFLELDGGVSGDVAIAVGGSINDIRNDCAEDCFKASVSFNGSASIYVGLSAKYCAEGLGVPSGKECVGGGVKAGAGTVGKGVALGCEKGCSGEVDCFGCFGGVEAFIEINFPEISIGSDGATKVKVEPYIYKKTWGPYLEMGDC